MPTALDLELLPAVEELIDEVGILVTITEDDQTYDAATGDVSGTPTAHANVKASPVLDYELRFIDGDVIRHGDARIYLAGKDLGFTPKAGFTVAAGGKTWKVVTVGNLMSGDQTAAWELQLRR